jgi:hypothetical protein
MNNGNVPTRAGKMRTLLKSPVLSGCILIALGIAAYAYSFCVRDAIRRPNFAMVYGGAADTRQALSATKTHPSSQSWAKLDQTVAALGESIRRTGEAEGRRDNRLRNLASIGWDAVFAFLIVFGFVAIQIQFRGLQARRARKPDASA